MPFVYAGYVCRVHLHTHASGRQLRMKGWEDTALGRNQGGLQRVTFAIFSGEPNPNLLRFKNKSPIWQNESPEDFALTFLVKNFNITWIKPSLKQVSIQYNFRYQESQQQYQRPQRNSYSGPPSSDGYFRGQEVGRPVQEYSSPQVGWMGRNGVVLLGVSLAIYVDNADIMHS